MLLGALPSPDAADKGLSGFEISPCPPRPGFKRMSGRLWPAAHRTYIRKVGRHQDVVHGYIQQGAQGVEVVHRRQALAPLPLIAESCRNRKMLREFATKLLERGT